MEPQLEQDVPTQEDIAAAEAALASLHATIKSLQDELAAREEAEKLAEPSPTPAKAVPDDEKEVRLPKRKAAIFLAYNGHGYSVRTYTLPVA
jgi:ABC-type hemin transport system substrate-binding protein